MLAEGPQESGAAEDDPNLPLAVDLDGTLVHTDTLMESILAIGSSLTLARATVEFLRHGKAAFKRRVAAATKLEVKHLPYNAAFLDYLRHQEARGRRLILATAADVDVATAVASHLDIFDQVLASDGTLNLRGRAKAAVLVKIFGRKGFVYAGNDRPDLHVWREAAGAVIVNACPALDAEVAAQTRVVARFPRPESTAHAALRSIRPHQWLKNLLVFVPLLTAHAVLDGTAWLAAILTFLGMCAVASSIYLINDLTDLAADRRHPRKKLRPFAAGVLDVRLGLMLAAMILLAGVVAGTAIGILPALAIYAVTSISYSLYLKKYPVVDVFALAALYTIRLFAGGEATGYHVSIWLLGFSSFLFLSLATMKRVGELYDLAERQRRQAPRRGYNTQDVAILTAFGCAAAFAASLVLALFVQAEVAARHYEHPLLLWGIVPMILFWSCRLWLSTARGYMHDDPIVYAAHDWVSWLVALIVFGLLFMSVVSSGS